MHPIDIRKYKQDLRLTSRSRRENMSSEKKTALDEQIAKNIKKLNEYKPAKTVLIYVSTAIEVSTINIIQMALNDGKKVAVPRCIKDTREMEFHYINSVDELSPGTFSVLEPPSDFPVVTDFTGCLMIVPGMQFDMNGYRIGYGKGYYDRYMSKFTGISVGICYSNELVPFMYHGKYDKAVNIIVTDKKIKTCKR